ncbi:sodium/glutamate symporter [uncultured Shimia sp.]|uniref:sodium/glutamate symporter n=1 Tax=uncultured Shimia sp. TaxID=573152 RepID=UPI00260DADAC|nr:sodium/glutamate symporter [uncultured Shimia sp.]
MDQVFVVPEMITATLGFAVFLLGARLTRKVAFLREFNIPEPVTGGLIAAAIFALFTAVSGIGLSFETAARDYFLVVFFAGIGLNARLSDLLSGGKILAFLLMLTLGTIIVQNVVGVVGATMFGLPAQSGVLFGSAALIGGHGTAIAWAPNVATATGLTSSAELGVAMATLGLIAASLVGGPVAKFLVGRYHLKSTHEGEGDVVGVSFAEENDATEISHVTLMRVMLSIHVAIILGYILHEVLEEIGLMLPLFVPCLIVGIVLGNLRLLLAPKAPPVARTPTLAVISEFALGVFLAISLMTLDFSTLSGAGLAIMATIGAQTLITVVLVILVLFPILGRNYDAAVLASGFAGFSLGATPTAIANMTAVTKRYGPAPIAFVVLPLVSAFFVDIANAIVIQSIVNF